MAVQGGGAMECDLDESTLPFVSFVLFVVESLKIFFTTKGTKSTKGKRKKGRTGVWRSRGDAMECDLDESTLLFVSFVLFVVESLKIFSPRRARRARRGKREKGRKGVWRSQVSF
ncbi:hypothetical protein JCM31598_10830 [Desulfonatronum parangueonense]